MIQNTMWNLGGFSGSQGLDELYESERGAEVYSGHETKSSDYIGLIYPSDYGFASTYESCSLDPLFDIRCRNNNWLFKDDWYWTISPLSSYVSYVVDVFSDGFLTYDHALNRAGVRPSLYLKQDVKVVGGTGTSSDPYTLEI